MTILYVREQGAVGRREAEEIRVTLDQKVLARAPVREVEQLVLCGNVQLTTQAAAGDRPRPRSAKMASRLGRP